MAQSMVTAQGFLEDIETNINAELAANVTSTFGDIQADVLDNVQPDQRQFRVALPEDTDAAAVGSSPYQVKVIPAQNEEAATGALDAFVNANAGYFFSRANYTYSFQKPNEPLRVVVFIVYNANYADGIKNWTGSGGSGGGGGNQANKVLVQSLTDFPDPVSDVITLDPDILYFIAGTVDIGVNRLAGTDCHICGDNASLSTLQNDVDGRPLLLFTGYIDICNITLTALGSGSKTISLASSGGSRACIIRNVLFDSCTYVGTIIDYQLTLLDFCGFINCSEGLTFDGSLTTIAIEDFYSVNTVPASTLFEVNASASIANRLIFSECTFNTGIGLGTALKVDVGATIPTDGYQIVNCFFTGAGVYTTGVNADNIKSFWRFNKGIASTTPSGIVWETGNVSTTNITVVGNYVKVAFVSTSIENNRKFDDGGVTNRLRYIGADTIRVKVTIVALVLSSSGSPKITNRVAINGVSAPESGSQVDTNVAALDPPTTSIWIGDLNPLDYIELYTANNSNTNNLVGTNINMSVIEI